MGQPVVHWEFWSEDPEKISAFYEAVFGWKIRFMPEMDYRLVETGGEGGIDGGIMKPEQSPFPAKSTFYIDVDDLDTFAQKIRKAGGTILIEKQEVEGVGYFSLFKDPEGRVLGIWKQEHRD